MTISWQIHIQFSFIYMASNYNKSHLEVLYVVS